MATKFKDGLVSGDEIKSEGDIQAISGNSIIAVSNDDAKKISMHHDEAGGHIDATQKLEIDSPSIIVKAGAENILSGDATETKLHHSDDGSDRIVTTSTGITVYGSDGVTAKKFKFPVLEDNVAAEAGSTADTDFAFIQAQKIGTDADETSVFDFSLGDNKSDTKSDRDEFRFRFKSDGVNSNNEYSLMDIGALSNGVAILDLTVSHDLRDDDAVGESANSQIKAGKFIGEASLLAATVAPSTTTVNTQSSSTETEADQTLVVLDDVAAAIVGMRISGTGIAAGTTIAAINTETNTITLSKNTSAVIPAAENLTIETDFGKGLVNNTTDNLSEGTSNQYFTPARARGSISAATNATASGGGSLSYNNTTGVFTYTPPGLSSFLTSSSVPVASTTVVGGMKLTSDVDQTIAANGVSATADRTYAVQIDSDDNAVVNVPWTDSQEFPEYGTATSDAAGLVKIGYTANAKNYPVKLSNEQMYVNVPWTDTVPNTYAQQMNQDVRKTDDVEFNKLTANSDVEINGNFHVIGGHIVTTGNVTAFSSTISDKRLKSDITNISKALDKVGKINGVTFVRNHNGENAAGIIAQEVMEVLPEAVRSQKLPLHTDNSDEEYYVVEYDALTGLLVEAIKELKAEIDELKGGK